MTNPRTIDQLLGDQGISKFGTLSEDKFNKKLDDLAQSRTDFQDFAAEHGIRVIDDIPLAREKLMDAFRSYAAGFKSRPETKTNKTKVSAKKLTNTMNIMREGR